MRVFHIRVDGISAWVGHSGGWVLYPNSASYRQRARGSCRYAFDAGSGRDMASSHAFGQGGEVVHSRNGQEGCGGLSGSEFLIQHQGHFRGPVGYEMGCQIGLDHQNGSRPLALEAARFQLGACAGPVAVTRCDGSRGARAWPVSIRMPIADPGHSLPSQPAHGVRPAFITSDQQKYGPAVTMRPPVRTATPALGHPRPGPPAGGRPPERSEGGPPSVTCVTKSRSVAPSR